MEQPCPSPGIPTGSTVAAPVRVPGADRWEEQGAADLAETPP